MVYAASFLQEHELSENVIPLALEWNIFVFCLVTLVRLDLGYCICTVSVCAFMCLFYIDTSCQKYFLQQSFILSPACMCDNYDNEVVFLNWCFRAFVQMISFSPRGELGVFQKIRQPLSLKHTDPFMVITCIKHFRVSYRLCVTPESNMVICI